MNATKSQKKLHSNLQYVETCDLNKTYTVFLDLLWIQQRLFCDIVKAKK